MTTPSTDKVVPLPQRPSPTVEEIALDELEHVYAFVFRRVGNRSDAEDVTQQVALKAFHRLAPGAPPASIRAYLFATARTELAEHWARTFGLPVEEFREDEQASPPPAETDADAPAVDLAERILRRLPDNYARVLELRFLRNFTTREVAREMGTSAGNVRIMQLRALRAAAQVQVDD